MDENHLRDQIVPTRMRYGVLAMVCALSMITYLDRVCFGVAASAMAEELSLAGVADLKWAFTAFAIAYAVFEVPAGWLGDRWGPRGTLLRIVAWWSVCTALTGLVGMRVGGVTLGGLGTLIALRFLFGAGEAGAYPNITRAIHNWFPRTSWETAQGLVWMSGRLAGGLTPFLWAILVAGTSYGPPLVPWRGAFFVFGGIGLVWCLLFGGFFRNRPEDHPGVNPAERALIGSQPPVSDHAAGVPWEALLANRSLWALCAMYALINFGWAFNFTYLPGYLKLRYGIPDGDLWGAIGKGAPLWVGAFGCVAGGLAVQRLATMTGSRQQARRIVGMFALSLSAVAWWFAQTAGEVASFCALISAAALGVDLTLGAAWATCQDLGRRHAAVVAACMNTIGTLGSAAAVWVTGTIVEAHVARRAGQSGLEIAALGEEAKRLAALDGYQAVFSTYVLVYVAAAGCWLLIDSSRPLEPET